MALARELEQQPAEQQTDRQAPHVAEKELRHRLVEGCKTQDRAKQRSCDQRRQQPDRAGEAEQGERGGHRHELRHGHPVDSVHEIDKVDEPHAAEKEASALEPPRRLRQEPQLVRQHGDDGGNGDALHGEPGSRRQRAHVVDRPDHGEQRRRRRHGDELAALILQEGRQKGDGGPTRPRASRL